MKFLTKFTLIVMLFISAKAQAQANYHVSKISAIQTELASNFLNQSLHKKVLINFPAIDIPRNGKIELFDAAGKRIPFGKHVSIQNISQLPVGFYFLKVTCLTGSWTIEIKEQD